jgi:predicted nucleotidyltransferase
MEFGLSENTLKVIRAVFEKQPKVEKAILYGSRAIGNYKNGSDIDLMVEGKQLRLEDLLEIMVRLDDLELPYKFDLSDRKSILDNELLEHVERVGIIFYRKAGH